jgi:hypothetical protein
MLTRQQIEHALLSESNVYIHYTSAEGLSHIEHEGVIRVNAKMVIYLTQEMFKPDDAHMNLFIGATTHEDRGTHIVVLRLDSGIPVERVSLYEYVVRQTIRLDQHVVLSAGENPF